MEDLMRAIRTEIFKVMEERQLHDYDATMGKMRTELKQDIRSYVDHAMDEAVFEHRGFNYDTRLNKHGGRITNLEEGNKTVHERIEEVENKAVRMDSNIADIYKKLKECADTPHEDDGLPINHGGTWTHSEDVDLKRHFKEFLSNTATRHGRTRRAIACRIDRTEILEREVM